MSDLQALRPNPAVARGRAADGLSRAMDLLPAGRPWAVAVCGHMLELASERMAGWAGKEITAAALRRMADKIDGGSA